MASSFTSNVGLEKIATGEGSGTWGTTTNVNFDIIDLALNGQVSIATTSNSSGSPLTIDLTHASAAEAEAGNNLFIEITSASDLGASSYVTLESNDVEKICYFKNSLHSSRTLVLFQGTYNSGRDLEIPNGATALVRFDGGGSGSATVTNVFENESRTGSFAIDNLSLDGNAVTATDTDGDVQLVPNGDGEVVIGTGSAVAELTSSGSQDLLLTTNSNTNSGAITITDGTNGNITIAPNGTGQTDISRAKLTSPYTPAVSKTDSFTLAVAEIGAIHLVTKDSAVTLTLPDGGDTFGSYYGATWTIINTGSSNGQITISVPASNTLTWATGGSLVTVTGSDTTRKINIGGVATIIASSADAYHIVGSGIE
jgi:hypothetical protein